MTLGIKSSVAKSFEIFHNLLGPEGVNLNIQNPLLILHAPNAGAPIGILCLEFAIGPFWPME